jgi:N-acetylmuramoyl-L-alanine amidase
LILPDFQPLQVSKLRKNIDQGNNLRYFNKHQVACMRCNSLIFVILSLFILMDVKVFCQEKTSITKVVIDAGHGGKDPGTIGKKSQEKNIALQIALKLSDQIRAKCQDVTVICTRTTDEFIELHERAEIANRSKADLFISIHCNANPKHTFQGAETYVMGLHRTEANLEIAKKENAAILMEPDYSTNYNGFDPNSDESYITFTLFQNAFLDQSTRFASFVQDEMKDRVGMNDRGVRQAGFLVLYKTTMPSVLVETGFLSNPEEEKFLMSEKGQDFIASAICRAFCKFKLKMEGSSKEPSYTGEKKAIAVNKTEQPTVIHKDTSPPIDRVNEENVKSDKSNPEETHWSSIAVTDTGKRLNKTHSDVPAKDSEIIKGKREQREAPLANEQFKPKPRTAVLVVHKKDTVPGKSTLASSTTKHTGEKATPVVKKTGKKENGNSSSSLKKTGSPVEEKTSPVAKGTESSNVISETSSKPPEGVVFRIQFSTSPKEISTHSKKFEGLPSVWRYVHQGSYKYTTGLESSPEALSGLMNQVKILGYKDAFIVAFNADERISVAEARKLIGK